MKLTFATFTAVLLTTAASAMVAPAQTDPRDAALGVTSVATSGQSVTVSASALGVDGLSRSQIGTDEVKLSVFESEPTQMRPGDYR